MVKRLNLTDKHVLDIIHMTNMTLKQVHIKKHPLDITRITNMAEKSEVISKNWSYIKQ